MQKNIRNINQQITWNQNYFHGMFDIIGVCGASPHTSRVLWRDGNKATQRGHSVRCTRNRSVWWVSTQYRIHVMVFLTCFLKCWHYIFWVYRQDSSGKSSGEPDVCHLLESGGLRAYSEIPGRWSQTCARALQSGWGTRSVNCFHRRDRRYRHKKVSLGILKLTF